MPISSGGKHAREPHKHDEPSPADDPDATETKPDDRRRAHAGSAHKQRGPYRIGDVSTGDRNADLLRDPQVAAFAEALTRIRDPQRRALVEYLVREFARQRKAGEP